MMLGVQSKTRLTLSRLGLLSICFCAVTFLPLLQHTDLRCAGSAERECPCQEDGEGTSEEQLAVWSSGVRRRLNHRQHGALKQLPPIGNRLRPVASSLGRFPAIIGHQLANGLRAPLLT